MKTEELKDLSLEETTSIEGGSLRAPIWGIIADIISGLPTLWA